ncbi:hypothetical protein PROFUN_01324 [Planoprotostelium fungivorum]|uniref:Uncharacterized protein n=1 Tax=Planoprotostelium fungivorum TaxID=1890364 RepID=A0A2P6NZS8_9EUKA|nr:hypothetical protein PROFUN_01324 [Planoprotostelium fungivorum]
MLVAIALTLYTSYFCFNIFCSVVSQYFNFSHILFPWESYEQESSSYRRRPTWRDATTHRFQDHRSFEDQMIHYATSDLRTITETPWSDDSDPELRLVQDETFPGSYREMSVHVSNQEMLEAAREIRFTRPDAYLNGKSKVEAIEMRKSCKRRRDSEDSSADEDDEDIRHYKRQRRAKASVERRMFYCIRTVETLRRMEAVETDEEKKKEMASRRECLLMHGHCVSNSYSLSRVPI